MNNNILVTGASGFLGRYLCRQLIKKYDVTSISREKEGRTDGMNFIRGNITDIYSLSSIKGSYEACFHIAAIPDVGLCEKEPITAYNVNVNGTANVMKLCERLGIGRVIISSTIKVYGMQNALPIMENAAPNPCNYYGKTKYLSEEKAVEIGKKAGISLCIARITNIYGPDDSSPKRLIPHTILSLLKSQQPVVFGDGKAKRTFLHVDDAASFLVHSLENELEGIYNTGSREYCQIIDVIKRLTDISGSNMQPRFMKAVSQESDPEVSIEKVLKTGWKPAYTLDSGLKETFAWYRDRLADYYT